MPALTRWLVKTSLVYFVAGLLTGVLEAARGTFLPGLPGGLFPVYIHLFVVGWLTQLIVGIANWMFPKYTMQMPRGRESLSWAGYVLLNTGLLVRAVAEPALTTSASALFGWLLVVSALLQWLGGFAFAAQLWTRVKVK